MQQGRVARQLSHTEVLDVLANDPDGWINPENRRLAHLVISLRRQGVSDDVIYQAITDSQEATK